MTLERVFCVGGWGVIFGAPALFFAAYIYPYLPRVPELEICAVRNFLRVDCPGCGLTRSFAALMHGRILTSIDLHPLGVVIAAWFVYFWFRSICALISGRALPELLSQNGRDLVLGVFFAGLIFQWIVKLIAS